MNKRTILFSFLLLIVSCSAIAQDTCSVGVTEGMRFEEYKNLYDYHDYTPQISDVYNPTVAGIASFFIPGLGHIICNEWKTGIGYLAVDIVGTALNSALLLPHLYQHNSLSFAEILAMAFITAGTIGSDISSIVNAVRIAKIKNLYYRDLIHREADLHLTVSPSVTYLETPGSSSPTLGLSINFSF